MTDDLDEIKSAEGKYLTFTLANEEFGLSILKVREIIGYVDVTLIPQIPDYAKGVINLRGKVIPIIDLRVRFGMPATPHTERTCIIVVEISAPKDDVMLVGIVVDAVSEVMHIKAGEIEPPPSFGNDMDSNYILGMAKTEKDVKILLDIDRVINAQELSPLHQD
ncbi:MAG: chemotaxis protein CheW [Proteobacteria bacterium]|nr:chemotaxis protein CheW [Pseudomonadota bacterium]MBU1641631.1 chemotaxis protein CheW [Pseudomonadota bacterium]